MADNNVIKAAGGGAAIAALLTPSETSPIENEVVAACLIGGVAFLVSRFSDENHRREHNYA